MTKRQKAKVILDALDRRAPAPGSINWALEDMWLDAIIDGLLYIEIQEGDEE